MWPSSSVEGPRDTRALWNLLGVGLLLLLLLEVSHFSRKEPAGVDVCCSEEDDDQWRHVGSYSSFALLLDAAIVYHTSAQLGSLRMEGGISLSRVIPLN